MINYMIGGIGEELIGFIGIFFGFILTCVLLHKLSNFLPRDLGRDFAHDGKLSAGKPRGAGFIFILVFLVSAILFVRPEREIIIYLILVVAAMITGFLDDCSKAPWGEYKKGLLDLVIAMMTVVTFLNYNSSTIEIVSIGKVVTVPLILYGILGFILIWVSINVTNCTDGVDGLSGTLTIITLVTIVVIDWLKNNKGSFTYSILLFAVCILGYLWYNATPSTMLMGDAGSRAMGLFISIAVMKTGRPFLYLLVALVIILDGGLGLLKVALLRFGKIRILTNVRTPLHDQVRKVWGWSNTQTVFRFAIIQIIVSAAVIYMVM